MFITPALAALLLQTVLALPSPIETASIPSVKGSNNIDLPFFYPSVEMHRYPVQSPSSKIFNDSDDVEFAKAELLHILILTEEELEIKEYHRDSAGVLHVYARQLVNGIPIDNRNAAIHIQDKQVLVFSSSLTDILTKPSAPNSSPQPLSLEECVAIAERAYGIKRDDFPENKIYVQLPDRTLSLSYQFQLRDETDNKWLQVSVDSRTGQIVQAVDFTADAIYKVLALPKIDPTENFEAVNSPLYAASSPSGWHSDGTKTYTDTQGNNLISATSGMTSDGGADLDFTHEWDPTQKPSTTANRRAANSEFILNAFISSHNFTS